VSFDVFKALTGFFDGVGKTVTGLFARQPAALPPDSPDTQPAELAKERLPRHVAIIMDGNGRWALRRGLPRSAGHHAGTEALRAIIRECDALEIEALTIYAFSTENWTRSDEEVGALMGLLLRFFNSEIEELHEKNVKIRIIGDVEGLPEPQRKAVKNAMARTGENTGLSLNIALNYGGREELFRAARLLASQAVECGDDPASWTEADFSDCLYTAGLPDVDLLIRTSGELRLSNFLPWQTVYAEMIFNPVLWPDYTLEQFHNDLREYASRDRRFGKT